MSSGMLNPLNRRYRLRSMPRDRLHPILADPLFDDPAYRALPVAAVGMVWRLAEHYHKTDCAPLPTAPAELQAIARAHLSTWSRHRVAILSLINRWAPSQERYSNQRKLGRWTLAKAADMTNAKRQRARMARDANLAPSQTTPTKDLALPRPTPPNTPRQTAEQYRSPRQEAPASAFAD